MLPLKGFYKLAFLQDRQNRNLRFTLTQKSVTNFKHRVLLQNLSLCTQLTNSRPWIPQLKFPKHQPKCFSSGRSCRTGPVTAHPFSSYFYRSSSSAPPDFCTSQPLPHLVHRCNFGVTPARAHAGLNHVISFSPIDLQMERESQSNRYSVGKRQIKKKFTRANFHMNFISPSCSSFWLWCASRLHCITGCCRKSMRIHTADSSSGQ